MKLEVVNRENGILAGGGLFDDSGRLVIACENWGWKNRWRNLVVVEGVVDGNQFSQ